MALDNRQPVSAVTDAFSVIKTSVQASSLEIVNRAGKHGLESASVQLRNYGELVGLVPDDILALRSEAAVAAVAAAVDKQEATIYASWLAGPDRGMILGDDGRVGQLRPADILITGAVWAAALFWSMFGYAVESAAGPDKYQKMVVAALDERTTDCCLRAHGQVQPLNSKFELTGTPRFADRIAWPPFHWYCRTAGVLYQGGYDEGLSDIMRESAQKVLDHKAAGLPVPEIHPAKAYIVGGL